jgi:hypothetical protein
MSSYGIEMGFVCGAISFGFALVQRPETCFGKGGQGRRRGGGWIAHW